MASGQWQDCFDLICHWWRSLSVGASSLRARTKLLDRDLWPVKGLFDFSQRKILLFISCGIVRANILGDRSPQNP